jgi:hypothetical protein
MSGSASESASGSASESASGSASESASESASGSASASPSTYLAVTKIRIVYKLNSVPYVEIYSDDNVDLAIKLIANGNYGWSLITPVAGSIPSGYSSTEVVLDD